MCREDNLIRILPRREESDISNIRTDNKGQRQQVPGSYQDSLADLALSKSAPPSNKTLRTAAECVLHTQ